LDSRKFAAKPIVFFTLLGFIAFSLFSNEAFAQQSPEDCGPNQVFQLGFCQDIEEPGPKVFWIETDFTSYDDGDTIRITGNVGTVSTSYPDRPVTIIVIGPDGKTAAVAQTIPSSNGSFSHTLIAGGSMQESGVYEVTATYGTQKSTTTFSFESSSSTTPTITVSTDRLSYKEGDTIVVSGEVKDLIGQAVSIFIINPDGDIVAIAQVDVNSDKTFSTEITAGNTMQETGTYTVSVTYGGLQRTAETSFWLEASSIAPPSPIFTNFVSIPAGTSVPGCEETDECWDPPVIIVDVGATVTWSNDDIAAHTVTSGTAADGPSGIFDSGMFMARDVFSHTFTRAGEFEYFCAVHPWMAGIVIVEGSTSGGGTILDTIPPKILQPKDIVIDAADSKGAFVTYEVLAIDNEDGIVKPSCSPSSGSLFTIGDTQVVCSAFDSSGNTAPQKSFLVTVNAPSLLIPNWIKEVAAFWCEDKIDDASFIEGIQYLIDNGIIIVQATTSGSGGTQEIPSWVKNNACWWSQGLISNEDFASGLKYLIEIGVIKI